MGLATAKLGTLEWIALEDLVQTIVLAMETVFDHTACARWDGLDLIAR